MMPEFYAVKSSDDTTATDLKKKDTREMDSNDQLNSSLPEIEDSMELLSHCFSHLEKNHYFIECYSNDGKQIEKVLHSSLLEERFRLTSPPRYWAQCFTLNEEQTRIACSDDWRGAIDNLYNIYDLILVSHMTFHVFLPMYEDISGDDVLLNEQKKVLAHVLSLANTLIVKALSRIENLISDPLVANYVAQSFTEAINQFIAENYKKITTYNACSEKKETPFFIV